MCTRALELVDTSIYQGEAFATHSNSVSAELEKGKIKSSQSGFESGIGIRIFKDGSMGYAHASLERVKSAVDTTIAADLTRSRDACAYPMLPSLKIRIPMPALQSRSGLI